MSSFGESGSPSLQRPYTVTSFQHKLDMFVDLIREITYQDAEATPEERRQWITGTGFSGWGGVGWGGVGWVTQLG